MNGQGNPIIPAHTAIKTFRDSGYRNTASAVAELIDNSLEAMADDIQILAFQEYIQHTNRASLAVTKIAVYDNGYGMSPEVLQICLQFGNGTRLNSRKGIGRFGIGLPQASVSQCKRVDIYSWEEGRCHHTYLDIDEVVNQELQDVNPVNPREIPSEISKHIEGGIGENGTLVVWSECDRLDFGRAKTLFNRMKEQLCRVYRHYLDADNEYGTQRKISVIIPDTGSTEREVLPLYANDPLYLLTPNNVPGFRNSPTNEQYGDTSVIPIEYDHNGSTSNVEMRFSIAKPTIQDLGGGSPVGSHYRDNTGISFMRAGREIDFGTFGYFNPREERQRWWGCEIRFSPILDELFGVTNNKQSIRGAEFIDEAEFKKEHPDDWEEQIDENLRLRMRVELSREFARFHRTAMNLVRDRAKGSRGGSSADKAKPDVSTQIANRQLEGVDTETKSAIEGLSKTTEQKNQEWITRLLEGDENLTEDDAEAVAGLKLPLKIEKDFKSWPGSQFFTVEITGSTAVVVFNQTHPFYTEVYERLREAEDPKAIEALDLLLYGYARMQDELYSQHDAIDEMSEHWGRHVKGFLKELREHE